MASLLNKEGGFFFAPNWHDFFFTRMEPLLGFKDNWPPSWAANYL